MYHLTDNLTLFRNNIGMMTYVFARIAVYSLHLHCVLITGQEDTSAHPPTGHSTDSVHYPSTGRVLLAWSLGNLWRSPSAWRFSYVSHRLPYYRICSTIVGLSYGSGDKLSMSVKPIQGVGDMGIGSRYLLLCQSRGCNSVARCMDPAWLPLCAW